MKGDDTHHYLHQLIMAKPRDVPADCWVVASTVLDRPVPLAERPYPCLCIPDCRGWGEERGVRCLCRSRDDLDNLPKTCCAHRLAKR